MNGKGFFGPHVWVGGCVRAVTVSGVLIGYLLAKQRKEKTTMRAIGTCISGAGAVVMLPSCSCNCRGKPSFLCPKPLHLPSLSHSCRPLRCSSPDDLSPISISISISVEEEDGVRIEIQKLPNNSRRIVSSIAIDAPLDAVWSVLTDYEGLPDFIPGLALSQLLEKTPDYARLYQVSPSHTLCYSNSIHKHLISYLLSFPFPNQIGQQNLAFGLKFNARGILDCYEKQLETLPSALKRDIEFNMVQGDFEIFQGKWSILQQHDDQDEMLTTLSYLVDVKPKLWLPVQLVEARLCKEIKLNLACIRQQAHKQLANTL